MGRHEWFVGHDKWGIRWDVEHTIGVEDPQSEIAETMEGRGLGRAGILSGLTFMMVVMVQLTDAEHLRGITEGNWFENSVKDRWNSPSRGVDTLSFCQCGAGLLGE